VSAPEVEPTPTAEHIDAVARACLLALHDQTCPEGGDCRARWPHAAASGWFDGPRFIRDVSNAAAVHEALAANLPADVMLAALVDRGVLRSPETAYPIAWTIHVEVPTAATKAEVDTLNDRIADAAYGMERGMWDPFVAAHTLDCVASDHCAAPRPNGPPYPKPEVAP